MSESLLDKVLHLQEEKDRDYLIDRLQTRRDLPLNIRQIKQAIDFLYKKMSVEWLTLYPFHSSAHTVIKVGPQLQHALDFFCLVRLALALETLSVLSGFHTLLKRIESPTYQRLSTILETLTAARYKLAGYEVELEPNTKKGSADFRVKYQDEWIYFECKKENPAASKYFLKAQQYVDKLVKEILTRAESKLPITHRIDIIIDKKPKVLLFTRLADEISKDIDRQRFDQWKRMSGIRFAINRRDTKLEQSRMGVHLLKIKAETTPTQLSETNAHIQVIYDPYGSKELQKVRRLIREAKDQLPADMRSIIVLETEHTKRMVSIAEQKLRQPGYEKIIVILVVGNGAWSVPNAVQSGFPLDFVKTAVLPDPI